MYYPLHAYIPIHLHYIQPYVIPNTIYYTPNICWLPIYTTTTPHHHAITTGEERGYTTPWKGGGVLGPGAYMCMCECLRTYACTYECTYAYACAYACTYACTYASTFACIYVCTYACTYIHRHMHIHIHIHYLCICIYISIIYISIYIYWHWHIICNLHTICTIYIEYFCVCWFVQKCGIPYTIYLNFMAFLIRNHQIMVGLPAPDSDAWSWTGRSTPQCPEMWDLPPAERGQRLGFYISLDSMVRCGCTLNLKSTCITLLVMPGGPFPCKAAMILGGSESLTGLSMLKQFYSARNLDCTLLLKKSLAVATINPPRLRSTRTPWGILSLLTVQRHGGRIDWIILSLCYVQRYLDNEW